MKRLVDKCPQRPDRMVSVAYNIINPICILKNKGVYAREWPYIERVFILFVGVLKFVFFFY